MLRPGSIQFRVPRRALMAGLLLSASCRPADYRPALDARVTDARGPIGLVTLPIPVLAKQALPVDPATKAEAARQGAVVGGAGTAGGLGAAGVSVIASTPAAVGTGPAAPLVGGVMVVVGLGLIAAGVVLAPVAALIGAGVGWSGAQDDAERAASLAALERALAEWAPGPEIAAAFAASAPQGEVVQCPSEIDCLAPDGTRPELLLSIQPQLPRIAAEGSIDPDLTVSLQLDAAWKRAADGEILQRRTWSFTGETEAFSAMAENDAARLRDQMRQATHRLAALVARDSLHIEETMP
jgi:hypothetical protein